MKPTAKDLKQAGPIRLGCNHCDRDDYDGVKLLPGGWSDISKRQSLAESLATYDDGDLFMPPDYSVLDWETHVGICPECQLAGHH